MEKNKPGFQDDTKATNDNRKSQTDSPPPKKVTVTQPKKETFGQRWNAKQFSKTAIAWTCLGMILGTMIVGFTWGGWVTGGSSAKAATDMSTKAVTERLSAICVAQFQQDPDKDEKLVELKLLRSTQQKTLIAELGWSIMPGDEKPEPKVATSCAKALAQLE